MAESCTANRPEITIEDLKREMKVTDGQLDSVIEEADLPEVAAYFDNSEDYVEKLELSSGQQTDVKTKTFVHGVQAGMKQALKYWRNKSPCSATFKALILILLVLSKQSVAVDVCKYLSDKSSSAAYPAGQERVLLGPKASYRDYLRSRYRVSTSSSQWPPLPTKKVFKLAMIQKETIARGKIDEELVRLSVTGKVDDILLQKSPIELQNILRESEDGRKFALIEGAPGSGKSTLALHMCQEWADRRLFQEYGIVVLVRLRDPCIRDAKTIADLLPRVDKAMANEIEAVMKSTFGKGVLWVLDGWDELPSDLPSDSIINKLIQPDKSQESPLPECSLIVTSRPTSSAELHPLVSSRVEVLGFTPEELEQYFTECLKGNIQAVKTLLARIRENPVVEGSCYLPLNASIVAHVFLSGEHSLPTSNHGVFKSLVQCTLKRYLKDRLGKTTPVGDITSPDSLPSEIRAPFTQLCELAFYGIERNKVTFSTRDLAALSSSEDISDVGLLQSIPSVIGDGHQIYFSFLHLSIQELLAAIHISWMSPKQQISVFQNLFNSARFSAVFQFYAGITKLRAERPFLSLLPRFLCPVPASVFDLVRKIVRFGSIRLVPVCHCLYESEDHSLCKFVADGLNRKLYLTDITLSPLDCLSLGYFLSVACRDRDFTLQLGSCSISDQGCKFLIRGIQRSQATSTSRLSLAIFIGFNIHCNVIPEVLEHTDIVHRLDFSFSFSNIGGSVFKRVCEALSTNMSLKELELRFCKLTTADGPSLRHLLSTNKSVESLSLSGYHLAECCSDIAAGLSINRTLNALSLTYFQLTDQSLEELCTGQNDCIKTLDIFGNELLTESGVLMLTKYLATHYRLQRLIIPRHINASEVKKRVLSELCEGDQTRRNELHLPVLAHPRL